MLFIECGEMYKDIIDEFQEDLSVVLTDNKKNFFGDHMIYQLLISQMPLLPSVIDFITSLINLHNLFAGKEEYKDKESTYLNIKKKSNSGEIEIVYSSTKDNLADLCSVLSILYDEASDE